MKYLQIALLVIVLVGISLLGITLKGETQLIQPQQNLFHLKLNKAHLSKKYQKRRRKGLSVIRKLFNFYLKFKTFLDLNQIVPCLKT